MTNQPSTDLSIHIVRTEDRSPALYAEIVDATSAAYEEPFAHYFEAMDPVTHVLACAAGRVLAHACWIERWLKQEPDGPLMRTAYIEAVGTRPEAQWRGLASRVLRAAGAAVAAEGFDVAGLSPSDPAFYARLGWELWRGPLHARHEDGTLELVPGEQAMVLRLPRTPPLDLGAALSVEWREDEVY
ncbi:MAG: GNAT family N-acetyltransferase [Sphingomonadaceae bacterium]|nr:GNAT family N-acetyltransferase [Sphingomonadaceae bacterium]